ncbi:hypothetical protein [Klebsiella pneumoniae]|uniref:hypothetical protein n=1 Tax=Klebsiella pneumoniae TaxID=573 RepID=UPI003F65BEBB
MAAAPYPAYSWHQASGTELRCRVAAAGPGRLRLSPGKQLRRWAMASGTELRLCRVAAAPYPAYSSGSDCL